MRLNQVKKKPNLNWSLFVANKTALIAEQRETFVWRRWFWNADDFVYQQRSVRSSSVPFHIDPHISRTAIYWMPR